MKQLIERLRFAKRLSEYPCEDHLHNALRFVELGQPDVVYSEICWALAKAGGELTQEEKQRWRKYNARTD